MHYHFEWDPAKEQRNIRRRRLSFRRAASVFRDPKQLTLYDESHSEREERWITLGLDSSGILLVVVHTFEQVSEEVYNIRIISARKADALEDHQYQESNR